MNVISQSALTSASAAVLSAGIRILQGFRLADTDAAHVSALLDFMDPPPNATVLDIGCGFGEVARLMNADRPDLRFVLVNSNAFQLNEAPAGFSRMLADMHSIPLGDASVDVAMFLYSLCHSDFPAALLEAARVTRPGGRLFVFDYERTGGDDALMSERLCARALPNAELLRIAELCGWRVEARANPAGCDDLFRALYQNDEEYDLIFRDLRPVLLRMVRA